MTLDETPARFGSTSPWPFHHGVTNNKILILACPVPQCPMTFCCSASPLVDVFPVDLPRLLESASRPATLVPSFLFVLAASLPRPFVARTLEKKILDNYRFDTQQRPAPPSVAALTESRKFP